MKLLICLSVLAVVAYCAPSTTAKPDGTVKEADGHRRHHHRGGWGGFHSAPIVDRNVCDLDASVLVVVEGGRRGYNKARRVKCADVAAADEDSCTVCCQNAARRDQSVRNEDIFGFLTVIDHFTKDDRHDDDSWSRESHDDDYARRGKRQAAVPVENAEEAEAEEIDAEAVAAAAATGNQDYGRGKNRRDSLENFEPVKNFRNLKCLCCAPRRQLPPPQIIPVPVPVYSAPAYPQYPQPAAAPAQYAPQQQYQAPVQAAPAQYQAPAQAAPAQYQAPAQAAPAQYQAPAQAAPAQYQAPAQAAPAQYQPAQAAPANNY